VKRLLFARYFARLGHKEGEKEKQETKIKRSWKEVKEYSGKGNCVKQTVTRKTTDLLSSGVERTYNLCEMKRETQVYKKKRNRGKEKERQRDLSLWGQGGSWIESLCLLGGDHRP